MKYLATEAEFKQHVEPHHIKDIFDYIAKWIISEKSRFVIGKPIMYSFILTFDEIQVNRGVRVNFIAIARQVQFPDKPLPEIGYSMDILKITLAESKAEMSQIIRELEVEMKTLGEVTYYQNPRLN